jgi:SpoVK/Ycf46/Vps4 family AAA+-type ATPase
MYEKKLKGLSASYALEFVELFDTTELVNEIPFKKNLSSILGTKRASVYYLGVDQLYSKLASISKAKLPSQLQKNITLFCQFFSIPRQSDSLIAFALCMTLDSDFNRFVNYIQGEVPHSFIEDLSEILGLQESEFHQGISALVNAGLLHSDSLRYISEEEFLILPKSIAHDLLHKQISKKEDFLLSLVTLYEGSKLNKGDLAHLDIDTLVQGCKKTSSKPNQHFSVLLHGQAGTGKTSLARYVSHTVGAKLLKVQAKGDELVDEASELKSKRSSGELRLQHFDLVAKLVNDQKNTILLLDECENIFDSGMFSKQFSKELLHEYIENKPVVSIWITNHLEYLPESAIRRFDLVYEIPELTKTAKAKIISKHVNDLSVGNEFINRLANIEHILPAHISKAANLARICGYRSQSARECISQAIENMLAACGLSTNTLSYVSEQKFNPKMVNIESEYASLEQVEEAVIEFSSSRTLLTGPPGTGKTAFVNYLCEKADFKLISVKASDLLSKWVGESEQNIAQLFKQATQEMSAIFIDEADSLLCSREQATANWEVQIVNELLCQMEQFQLPLFAATNFAKNLDKAVIRRFDFKLNLAYLTPIQCKGMFRQTLGRGVLKKTVINELSGLSKLTPGDFAIVKRQMKFSKRRMTQESMLSILKEQNALKGGSERKIGFVI